MFMEYLSYRFGKAEVEAQMHWDTHVLYPAMVPVVREESIGYRHGTARTGELPGTGWCGQSFADNPSPADNLRLGARVPTQGDVLLQQLQSQVVM